MAINILDKYGILPQSVYPESLHSSLSGPLNTLLKMKLREHALILRNLYSELQSTSLSSASIKQVLRARKEKLMKEVYRIMTATLGVPPMPNTKFVWEYYDSDGKFGKWEGTPLQYFRVFGKTPYSVSI
jgi:bleomycin hydrolase